MQKNIISKDDTNIVQVYLTLYIVECLKRLQKSSNKVPNLLTFWVSMCVEKYIFDVVR